MQIPELPRREYNPVYHHITLAVVFAAFAFRLQWQLVILTILTLAALFSPGRKKIFRGFLKFVLPLIFIGFVVNGIFFTGNTAFAIGPVTFKSQGLYFAARVAVRLAMIVISIGYFFSRVSPETVSEYLAQRGADRRLIYIYLLSLAMVHLMRDKLQKIYVAQSARGLDTSRSLYTRLKYLLPMLVPLTYSYIAESLDRGIALRAANFSDRKRNPNKPVIPFTEIAVTKSGLMMGRAVLALAVAAWIVGLLK